MNYLALSALYKVSSQVVLGGVRRKTPGAQTYARENGPFQAQARQIYAELRRNIVDNVFKVRPVSLMGQLEFTVCRLGV
jgi:hypothetical protein